MFEKVKGLLAMEEQLAKMQEKMNSYNTSLLSHGEQVLALHTKVAALHENVTHLNATHKELSQTLSSDLLSIKSICTEFEHELGEFKLLRSNFSRTAAERVSTQVEEGLREQLSRLKVDVTQYNTLKMEL